MNFMAPYFLLAQPVNQFGAAAVSWVQKPGKSQR